MADKKNPEDEQHKVGEHHSLLARLEPEKTKDLGEGVIEAIVSTGALDHHNEIIKIDGVDTTNYHGPVLYGHDYQGLPIGKTLSLVKMKNKIKATFQLAVKEYPFAALVYEMIKGGFLSDVSIGGIVKRWSDDFKIIEELVMKEFSVVPIGANPDAVITAVKALDIDPEQLQKQYHEFARKVLVDKLAGMDNNELNSAITVMENLLAALKESAKADSTAREDDPHETRVIKHITLRDSAKAVVTQGQRIIKIVKVKRG